jgi:hypothetical protein
MRLGIPTGNVVLLTVPGRRTRGQPGAAPILKYYAEHFKVVAPYFDAKPGDPVERFAAEADKPPVFEVLPG